MPKVLVDIRNVILVTDNHSGYIAAKCLVCRSSGWLDGQFGYTWKDRKKAMSNRLIHAKNCSMNAFADAKVDNGQKG